MNHVYIDDYVEDADAPTLAAVGVAFAGRLCELPSTRGGEFNVIVGSDELSCSVRFIKSVPAKPGAATIWNRTKMKPSRW